MQYSRFNPITMYINIAFYLLVSSHWSVLICKLYIKLPYCFDSLSSLKLGINKMIKKVCKIYDKDGHRFIFSKYKKVRIEIFIMRFRNFYTSYLVYILGWAAIIQSIVDVDQIFVLSFNRKSIIKVISNLCRNRFIL